MKILKFLLLLVFINWPLAIALAASNPANPIILSESSMRNLRLETVLAEDSVFEETIFALGRIDVLPGHSAAISSRVSGRALEVRISPDYPIEKGTTALVVEARQFGDPPPRIEIHAPISGVVSEVNVISGKPIEPSDVLAEIINLETVYAVAYVPEHLAGRLKVGQFARIRVPAFPERVFTAQIAHLGAKADPAKGALEAAFHVPNPEWMLRPGMRAEFSIVCERRENVFSIPRSAIVGNELNRFVFVRDFELKNAFVKAPVVTGQSNDTRIEIISGLFPGDEVVTNGAYSLSFAGSGSMSLKEALDAAHGHEHAEDGSELTQQTISSSKSDSSQSIGNRFWMILSGILFVLLLVIGFRKKKGSSDA